MITFEGYERRIEKIKDVMAQYGIESFEAAEVNWPGGTPAALPFTAVVAARYHARPAPARIIPLEGGRRILVELAEPLRAVTPGQAVVVYEGDRVVCGGTIV